MIRADITVIALGKGLYRAFVAPTEDPDDERDLFAEMQTLLRADASLGDIVELVNGDTRWRLYFRVSDAGAGGALRTLGAATEEAMLVHGSAALHTRAECAGARPQAEIDTLRVAAFRAGEAKAERLRG